MMQRVMAPCPTPPRPFHERPMSTYADVCAYHIQMDDFMNDLWQAQETTRLRVLALERFVADAIAKIDEDIKEMQTEMMREFRALERAMRRALRSIDTQRTPP